MSAFLQSAYLVSAGRLEDLLPRGPAELAFAGRSNVGKSSAINALAGRRRLAFVSRTPGRTQTINFYALGESARLVDLPGYGYARAPRAQRASWEGLVRGYLRSRAARCAVVLVMDSRHAFTPQDEQLIAWLEAAPLLVLLTKADRLSRGARLGSLEQAKRRLGGAVAVRLFSSRTHEGVEDTRRFLEAWLRDWDPAAGIKDPRQRGYKPGAKRLNLD